MRCQVATEDRDPITEYKKGEDRRGEEVRRREEK